MYAAVDNTVILPGYVRADAAFSYSISPELRVQTNVENVLDRDYFVNADGNNNISPGAPRTFRISLTTRF
jgi:catecholate siderophore receptor